MSTIAIDFDGVIHKYSKGWQDGSIYDPPMPGAIEGIRALQRDHAVYVFTSREIEQVIPWLQGQGLNAAADGPPYPPFWRHQDQILVTNRKLPAVAYIDDRAIQFRGWNLVPDQLAGVDPVSQYWDIAHDVLAGAPESWDDDAAPHYIAVAYVRELERRLDALGVSREKFAAAEAADAVQETDGALLARMGTDAQVWAREFMTRVRRQPRDAAMAMDFVMGWFANAIGAGMSAGAVSNETAAAMVFEAIGEASMCWVPAPTGLFDSTHAGRVGERLMHQLGYVLPDGYHVDRDDQPPNSDQGSNVTPDQVKTDLRNARKYLKPEMIDREFDYHPATEITGPIHQAIRDELKQVAHLFNDLLPEGPRKTEAIGHLRTAMWAANSAVACYGHDDEQWQEDAKRFLSSGRRRLEPNARVANEIHFDLSKLDDEPEGGDFVAHKEFATPLAESPNQVIEPAEVKSES